MQPVTITLQGPGKNALSTAMMTHVIEQLRNAAGAPVLLTGGAGAFSAGLDLKEVSSLDSGGMAAFLQLLEDCMTALYLYPGPTAAAVNGHAIAGGCVLTLCCDARVATDDASVKIGLNEVALGLRFPPRVLSIVRARVPRSHEDVVLLGAGLHAPADALRYGLVDELAADPVAAAHARLQALAAHPPEAYARTKHDLRGSADSLASNAEVKSWIERSTPIWTSPDLRTRIAALLKKPAANAPSS